ncbi:MAG TPA: hypothetical protein PLQ01_03640, partial [Methanothrix sp.]|nr:hypothetical protein [Methanothrix sp.]
SGPCGSIMKGGRRLAKEHIFKKAGRVKEIRQGRLRGDRMPTSKKQLEKLNRVKKAKAEELSKQAALGSKDAQKKLKKLQKKLK